MLILCRQIKEKTNLYRKRLNQSKRLIQRNDLKNSFLLTVLFCGISIDIFGSRIADLLFCDNADGYWNTYFCFKSLESLLFSIVIFYAYKYHVNSVLKNNLFRWVLESWLAICSGDFLDNLFGDRFQTNLFDFVVLACIISSFSNILWKRYINNQ